MEVGGERPTTLLCGHPWKQWTRECRAVPSWWRRLKTRQRPQSLQLDGLLDGVVEAIEDMQRSQKNNDMQQQEQIDGRAG